MMNDKKINTGKILIDLKKTKGQIDCLVIRQMRVLQIKPEETYEWILKKHYAKRLPSISWAFGLFAEGILCGILTIGKPASYTLCENLIGIENKNIVYELNRLVINEGMPKNSLSYFVAKALRQLPKPLAIVSYADQNQNHHGYIYQATNWIYTGLSSKEKIYYTENGEVIKTRRHIDKKGKIIKTEWQLPKHRYVFFVGNKRQKALLQRKLKYDIKPYPKGDNKRYNADYEPNIQLRAFTV